MSILLVKNMVCDRCIMAVEAILQQAAISFQKVILGEIHLSRELTPVQNELLIAELKRIGFELIDNHTTEVIEKAKQIIIKKARNEDEVKNSTMNLSALLSDRLNYEYTHLSRMFSAIEGKTIEQFFIEQRIEKAKELLVYGQLTLSEIAFELNYSSVAHLSGQFKKITGLTPSYYKEVGIAKRKALDKI